MIKTKSKLFKIISFCLSLLFWILVWAIAAYKTGNSFLLPSPKDTLLVFSELASTLDFWRTVSISLGRILIGILISIVLGIPVAVASTSLVAADSLFSPLMTVIKATPIASFIVLALLWMDKNTLPIFITILIVLPIVVSNICTGIRSTDKDLLEVAKVYRFSFGMRIRRIYIPSVMPYFLAACRASLGMAWKAGIAAEVLCTPKYAIGTKIYLSKTYLETTELFAWTLAVIIFSLIIEKLLILILNRLAGRLHVQKKEADNA